MRSLHLVNAASFEERETPIPSPGAGEVLVRVKAAGVTPSELLWYPTTHTSSGEIRTGATPSHEFAGEIAQIGEDVIGFAPGEQIYGMNDWFLDGALAEYCIARPDWIATKPRNLSHEEAASAPISVLTAWQGLFDRAALQPSEKVLVHGGAGAVGVYVVQLARDAGAYVIATGSAHNLEFLRELGAHEALDYRGKPFEQTVRDVDIAFDAVGGDTLHRSKAVLKPGGRMVAIAAGGDAESDEQIRKAFFIVEPKASQLAALAEKFEAGALRPIVDTVALWNQAADAYLNRIPKQGRGKVVVRVA